MKGLAWLPLELNLEPGRPSPLQPVPPVLAAASVQTSIRARHKNGSVREVLTDRSREIGVDGAKPSEGCSSKAALHIGRRFRRQLAAKDPFPPGRVSTITAWRARESRSPTRRPMMAEAPPGET